jgi:hypothetical protein
MEIKGKGSLKIERKFYRGRKDVDKEIQLLYLY